MAMTSIELPSRQGLGHGATNKITKTRNSRPRVVKPILRKLHGANPDRNSLDLDRSWEEQVDEYSAGPALEPLDYAGSLSLDGGASDWTDSSLSTAGYGARGRKSSGSGSGSGSRVSGSRMSSSVTAAGGSIGSVSSSGHRSVRDVSFTLSTRDAPSPSVASRAKLAHVRTISGASHASLASAATSGSGGRNGSFVHPFQQMPRASSPQLFSSYSHANSVSSDDTAGAHPANTANSTPNSPSLHGFYNVNTNTNPTTGVLVGDTLSGRSLSGGPLPSSSLPLPPPSHYLTTSNGPVSLDRSPTIAEDADDDHGDTTSFFASASHTQISETQTSTPTATTSTAATAARGYFNQDHRQPSFSSQHSLSPQSDGYQTIRGLYGRSRFAPQSQNNSRSDLPLSSGSSVAETPLSTTATFSGASHLTATTPSYSNPSPLSPLRNSLEMSDVRIRSYSEINGFTRQQQVQRARLEFEAKERAKDEKYEREQLRKRERADNKDRKRKGSSGAVSLGHGSMSSGRNSSSLDTRQCGHRKTKAAGTKSDFLSSRYDHATPGQTPRAPEEVHFQAPKRRKTAKRKTTGAWTVFMLWLRTRLFKLERG